MRFEDLAAHAKSMLENGSPEAHVAQWLDDQGASIQRVQFQPSDRSSCGRPELVMTIDITPDRVRQLAGLPEWYQERVKLIAELAPENVPHDVRDAEYCRGAVEFIAYTYDIPGHENLDDFELKTRVIAEDVRRALDASP